MKMKMIITSVILLAILQACKDDDKMNTTPLNPDSAGDVSVDRFSSSAAHLFVRNTTNNFPGANMSVNFDSIPAFITNGLGPQGQHVKYYNFDVQSTSPAPIYVLFKEGSTMPVSGQLNIVNVIPGDANYNDFWQVFKVTVPGNYVANTITSYDQIMEMQFPVMTTNMLVNCPIVPKGSKAALRFSASESNALTRGWYKSKVVYYFNFFEKEIMVQNGMVPTSDIYVAFNINPDIDMGGPPSGFKTEDMMATGQTHNVPETIPSDAAYSPLWDVQIYDNSMFSAVSNLESAEMASLKAMDAAIVNCPIVWVQ